MVTRNAHVSDFIEYYCRLPVEPEYALLIKGAWGCGKSHLVNETIEKIKNTAEPVKFLFVSLYGVTTTEDIEAKFFQSLNPNLASKGMVFAGKLAKGVLKDKLGLSNINIAGYLTDTKDYVLVFDDLERCSMPLKDIMGYINHFVEKGGYKVILIADEVKLINENRSEDKTQPSEYSRIKEKLIGKSLEIVADVSYVFDVFVEKTINDDAVGKILKSNKNEIITQFNCSKYNNLRSLRKSLIDFERLYVLFDTDVKEKNDLVTHLVTIFIIISMEVHSGGITPKEISKLFTAGSISRQIRPNEDLAKTDKFDVMVRKYEVSFYDPLIEIDAWVNFFDKGVVNININNTIKKSQYFRENNTPSWIKLWHLYDLNDELFDKYYKDVKHKFDSYQYINLGELKHVGGIFLRLANEGLLGEKNSKKVLVKLNKYIDHVFSKNLVKVNNGDYESLNGRVAHTNLCWTESEGFVEFSNYLNENIKKSQKDALTSQANDVLVTMKKDLKLFYSFLCQTEYEKSKFQSKPIMQHLNMDEFVDTFINLRGSEQRTVIYAISHRYDNDFYNEKIIEDYDWLKKLTEKLHDEVNSRNGKVTGFIIKSLIPEIEASIKKLAKSLPGNIK